MVRPIDPPRRLAAVPCVVLGGLLLFCASCSSSPILPPDPNALGQAVRAHDARAVAALLKRGANALRPLDDGTPLLNAAAAGGDTDIVQLLLGQGAHARDAGPLGVTALMAAARQGRLDTANALMDWGADRDATDVNGLTALDLAACHGYPDLRDAIAARGVARTQPHSMPMSACGAPPKGPAQAWTLACLALLEQWNDDACFCLGNGQRSVPKDAAGYLADSWNVHNHAEALAKLRSLSDGAWAKDFAGLADQARPWAVDELGRQERKLGLQSERTRQLELAWRKGQALGPGGIWAWDLVRYLWVASHAYAAGYLGEDEAWGLMLPVACRLRATFGSWKDCWESYLAGRQFWRGGLVDQPRMEAVAACLLDPGNPNSLWTQHPWNEALDCPPPPAIQP